MEISLEERIKRIGPDKFLSKIHDHWAEKIIALAEGKKVLEVGCGYGFLTDTFSRRGFDACGIDADEEAIEVGRSLYPRADLRTADAYHLPFADDSFDTVVFHEVIHHLDIERGLKEAQRVSKRCVVVFDPNPNLLVKLCRKVVRHQDPEAPFKEVVRTLEGLGCKVTYYRFSDILAMPLSGGFVGPRICPDIPFLHDLLIRLDQALGNMLNFFGCARFFCWRYLIKAEK